MYLTIEQFENNRISKILEGILIVGNSIAGFFKKYHAAKQRKFDKQVALYIKDNADFDRYQRRLLTDGKIY